MSDDDLDDKPTRPPQRPQSLGNSPIGANILALLDEYEAADSQDDEDDRRRRRRRIAAEQPAQRRAPLTTVSMTPIEAAAAELTDYSRDRGLALVTPAAAAVTQGITTPAALSEPTAGGSLSGEALDKRAALNEMLSVRRLAGFAARLGRLDGADAGAPTERDDSRVTALPPQPTERQSQLTEGPTTADAYVALEYVSPFITDPHTSYDQGDEFGFSDKPLFSEGREAPGDTVVDRVPSKRLISADDADDAATTREAANYQHSFLLSTGRSDATLPVAALASADLVPSETKTNALLDALGTANTESHLAQRVGASLERARNGVPRLFSELSTATGSSPDAYERLRRRGNRTFIAQVLETTLEQARATDTGALGLATAERLSATDGGGDDDNSGAAMLALPADATARERKSNAIPRLEALAAIEEALAEKDVRSGDAGKTLPNMTRTRNGTDDASGPFTIVGAVLAYDIRRPVESLLAALGDDNYGRDDASVMAVDVAPLGIVPNWIALGVRLAARERSGQHYDQIELPWGELLASTLRQLGRTGRRQRRRRVAPEDVLRQPATETPQRATHVAAAVRALSASASAVGGADDDASDSSKRARRGGRAEAAAVEAAATAAGDDEGSEIISNEAKRKDRDDDLTAEPRDEAEPAGEDVDIDADDPVALARELRQEFSATSGIRTGRTVDVSRPGFLNPLVYTHPMLAVPLGWSPVAALNRVADAIGAAEGDARAQVWRIESVWRDIVELALYAKLVPLMRDDDYFPLDARRSLVSTLQLVGQRVAAEVAMHDASGRVFDRERHIDRLSAQKRLAELEAAMEAAEAESRPLAADVVSAFAEATAELAAIEDSESAYHRLVPAGIVPAVLAAHVSPVAHLPYLVEIANIDAPELILSATERLALAQVYATAEQQPADSRNMLETRPLARHPQQADDALYYPLKLGYLEQSTLAAIFADKSQEADLAVSRFATAIGETARLRDLESRLGSVALLGVLHRGVHQARPQDALRIDTAFARAVYGALTTGNALKHIYLAPPQLVTAESCGEAVLFFPAAFNENGVFSLNGVARLHKAAADDVTERADELIGRRGAERQIATAAQQYANEYFPASQHVLSEAALVDVNFNLADRTASRPNCIFATVGQQTSVNPGATLELLTSDALLGGGRAVVSSVPVVSRQEAIAGDANSVGAQLAAAVAKAAAAAKLAREGRANLIDAVVAAALADGTSEGGEDDEAALRADTALMIDDDLPAELEALDNAAREAASRVDSIRAQIAARGGLPGAAATTTPVEVASFVFFVAPNTLVTICGRVAATESAGAAVRNACAQFIAFYRAAAAARAFRDNTATATTFNAFRESTVALDAALRAAGVGTELWDAAGKTAQALVAAAAEALARPLAPRLLVLREADTHPDAVATQPFSELAALERATTTDRKNVRDALARIWYRVGDQYRWARLGYMRTPFNSSHAIALPVPRAAGAGFHSYQLLHLAVRTAIRELRQNKNDDDADEGESDDDEGGERGDADDADADDDAAGASATDAGRRSGLLQLRELLTAIEHETTRTQLAQTLWFDLFVVGHDADSAERFAADVSAAVLTLFAAIDSDRPLAATALLASDALRYRAGQRPLAIDPRAERVVDSYWQSYGAGAQNWARADALNTFYGELFEDDTGLNNQIDDAFYVALARVGERDAAAATTPETDEERHARAAQDAYEAEQQQAILDAARRRTETLGRLSAAGQPAGGAPAAQRIATLLAQIKAAEVAAKAAFDAKEELAGRTFEEVVDPALRERSRADQNARFDREFATAERARAVAVDQLLELYPDNGVRRDQRRAAFARLIAAEARVRRREKDRLEAPEKTRAAAALELRALLYADERAKLVAEIDETVRSLRTDLAARAAARERAAVVASLRGQLADQSAALTAHLNDEALVVAELSDARRRMRQHQENALAGRPGAESDRAESDRARIDAIERRLAESAVRAEQLRAEKRRRDDEITVALDALQLDTLKAEDRALRARLAAGEPPTLQHSARFAAIKAELEAVSARMPRVGTAEQTAAAAAARERALTEANAIPPDDLEATEAAAARVVKLTGELRALLAPPAAVNARIVELRRLINSGTTNRASVAEARDEQEMRGRIADFLRASRSLYTPTEVARRAAIYARVAVAAEPAVDAAADAATKAAAGQRTKVDAKLLESAAEGATAKDARLHSPLQSLAQNAPSRRKLAYYDAPLANLKELSARAAIDANHLVAASRAAGDVRTSLLVTNDVPPSQIDDYIAWALGRLASLAPELGDDNDDDDEPDEPAAAPVKRPRAMLDAYNDALSRALEQVVNAAIEARVRARLAAERAVGSTRVDSVAENSVILGVRKHLTATLLAKPGETRRVGDRLVRKVDLAATAVLVERYTAHRRASRATALLNSLGRIALRRDAKSPPVEIPRLLAMLLLPAAIERVKLQWQKGLEDAAVDAPYAVANRRDAPQAWRIAELVARYARTGRIPLLSTAAVAPASPYVQYEEIRSGAAASLAATGRVSYQPDRAAALSGFGLVRQHVSLGNGLHSALPPATDLFASALCVQLLRLYASVQTELQSIGGGGVADPPTFHEVWRSTQQSDAGRQLTRAVAKLPKARARLWCHLVMLFGATNAPAPRDYPITADALDGRPVHLYAPVFDEMRAVDIRLLVLVVLGFDYSPRVDRRTDDGAADDDDEVRMSSQYAYSRGHAAKMLLARAYYDEIVDRQFSTAPETEVFGALLSNLEVRLEISLDVPAKTPLSMVNRDAVLKVMRQFKQRTEARATTGTNGWLLVALTTERELRSAVQRFIVDSWTRRARPQSTAAPAPTSTQLHQIRGIGGKLGSLLIGGAARRVAINAVQRAAIAASPMAATVDSVVVDHQWLLVPRAALLGALVVDTIREATVVVLKPVLVGRAPLYEKMRERIESTVERILLLADDAGHLLRDDAELGVGAALQPIDGAALEVAPTPAGPAAAAGLPATGPLAAGPAAAVVAAPPPAAARTSLAEWRPRIETAIVRLFRLPFAGRFVGRDRLNPNLPSDTPFAPLGALVRKRLVYITDAATPTHVDALFVWDSAVRPAIDTVAAFYARLTAAEQRSASEIDSAFVAHASNLVGGALELGRMLARAEQARRVHHRFDANGPTTSQPLLAFAGRAASPYQDWHVLLLQAMSINAEPLPALRDFVSRHTVGGAPTLVPGALVYATAVLARPKPAVTTLIVEQCVPIYETLRFYFLKTELKKATKKAAAQTLERLNTSGIGRHRLWPLLLAPALKFVVVACQTTEYVRDQLSGESACYVSLSDLLPGRQAGGGVYRAYLPHTYDTYEATSAERAATGALFADAEHVVVLHEHFFAKASVKAKTEQHATLARFLPAAGSAQSTYTVAQALAAANGVNETLLSFSIPLGPSDGDDDAAADEAPPV